ncbi:acetate--CoA ligase [Flavobacterium sp. CBA20B-1]|uniref:acetate--CoA ligase n=1 Tax=unclassified Flavobacterium TaxID=196869 RepID=UPI0022242F20|nr:MULTISPECIES: acetate--CoA ligase [unclassified Flavobacterium]WCM42469.1 acetate--CoA ligase [Flavobacterium sp. CBA20B-1]
MSYYKITDLEQYFKHYKKSVREPRKFWSKIAEENFIWYQVWDKVFEVDFPKGAIKWFVNAKLNITKNCIDRHLSKRGEKTALIFEPNNPSEKPQHISYNELYTSVSKTANVLKSLGVKKGDRVCIYLPMIPELAITMLACARIGAIHSVIFAGFSDAAIRSRVQDCAAKIIVTSDGGFRGEKTIKTKEVVDKAIEGLTTVEKVLVVKRTNEKVAFNPEKDVWFDELYQAAENTNTTEIMDAEDPLFILYTSGSTGKPKGMVHTTAGYMVQTAYSFQNVFNYKDTDVFWCSADLGWITGHSYILYGALLNGATTVLFEGIPTYPDPSRYWEIIDKYKITHFYTAPTAIRSLMTTDYSYVASHDLSSLRVLGSVGEPINEEAWHWFNDFIGKKRCPIVDTWWQTETGSIMIAPLAYVTPTKPTYATLPLPGIQSVLMDEKNNEIKGNQVMGSLCVKFPWPSIARTIWGDHERFVNTYFTDFPGTYFTGDNALRDEVGYYRITGRADDVVIVSGHNLGTAPIEDAINQHPAVAESAVVGFPHDIKGNALYGYISLKKEGSTRDRENLKKEINQLIADHYGPIGKLDKMQFVDDLPKTRSGKILRRLLRSIAMNQLENFGDTSTMINPEVVQNIINGRV